MYKDDGIARSERANALIDEIARLERDKVAQAAADQRLEAARIELRSLQAGADKPPAQPGALAHLLVFAGTAGTAYLVSMLIAG